MAEHTEPDGLRHPHVTRRTLLAGAGAAALVTGLGPVSAFGQASDDFDIDAAFAAFMADLGRSADDGGGTVTFTGRDPILRSHFRIGASMALPAMAAAVGAAAIWQERTGDGQDVAIDLRDAVLNVNPIVGVVMQQRMLAGFYPPNDPVASSLTWFPTVNGKFMQAPVGLDNPFSFVPWLTKDGRHVNITGVYPHLQDRALACWRPTRRGPPSPPRSRAGTGRNSRRRCSNPAWWVSFTAPPRSGSPIRKAPTSRRPPSSRSARSARRRRSSGPRTRPSR